MTGLMLAWPTGNPSGGCLKEGGGQGADAVLDCDSEVNDVQDVQVFSHLWFS